MLTTSESVERPGEEAGCVDTFEGKTRTMGGKTEGSKDRQVTQHGAVASVQQCPL